MPSRAQKRSTSAVDRRVTPAPASLAEGEGLIQQLGSVRDVLAELLERRLLEELLPLLPRLGRELLHLHALLAEKVRDPAVLLAGRFERLRLQALSDLDQQLLLLRREAFPRLHADDDRLEREEDAQLLRRGVVLRHLVEPERAEGAR